MERIPDTRLILVREAGRDKAGRKLGLFECDCGNEVVKVIAWVRSGNTRSCGCLHHEAVVARNRANAFKHGYAFNGEHQAHPLYQAWSAMKSRCQNLNAQAYQNYGARGITVCDEWQEFIPFRDWALCNGWRHDLQLNRIDNNGNYEPSNCNFVTPKENSNNRRNNRVIRFNGETKTLSEWSDSTGIPKGCLSMRLNKYHWPIERALTEPVRGRKNAQSIQTVPLDDSA